jgi:hypothetical protein
VEEGAVVVTAVAVEVAAEVGAAIAAATTEAEEGTAGATATAGTVLTAQVGGRTTVVMVTATVAIGA